MRKIDNENPLPKPQENQFLGEPVPESLFAFTLKEQSDILGTAMATVFRVTRLVDDDTLNETEIDAKLFHLFADLIAKERANR